MNQGSLIKDYTTRITDLGSRIKECLLGTNVGTKVEEVSGVVDVVVVVAVVVVVVVVVVFLNIALRGGLRR